MNTRSKKIKTLEADKLTGEHPWGDIGQIVLLVIFLIVWISDSFIIHFATFLANSVPIYFRLPLALAILFGAVYFIKSAHQIIFHHESQRPTVIRTGVFGLVRHPLYLGSILFYAGLVVLTLSMVSLGLWMVILLFYHFIAKYEEELLRRRFGVEYEKYRREVAMWVPGITFCK